MLTYVPFLGWISAELVIAFSTLALAGGGGWGAKHYYNKYADKRDMEKIYTWLLANTGPKADYYDLTSMAIASSVGLPVDRVRVLCTINPKIKTSDGRLVDCWRVYEYDTQIRFI